MGIIKYIGQMDKIHIKRYVDNSIDTYVEPFAGSFSCGINLMDDGFFGKTVLNDLDRFVYSFWTAIKENPDKLYDRITSVYNSIIKTDSNSANYILMKIKESDDVFDLAAYEYIYSSNMSINGCKIDKLKLKEIDINAFIETSIRLIGTNITNTDYKECIDKYDSKNTLFMIDPPYNVKSIDKYYRCDCSSFNHKKLRDTINNINGKWILRYNDDRYINELYGGKIVLFETTKHMGFSVLKEKYYTNINYEEL